MFGVSKSPSIAGRSEFSGVPSDSNANSPTRHVGVVLGVAHTFTPQKRTPLKIAYFDNPVLSGNPDCISESANPNEYPKTSTHMCTLTLRSPDRTSEQSSAEAEAEDLERGREFEV